MSDHTVDWQKVRERLLVRMGLAWPSEDDAGFYLHRVATEASSARLWQRLGDNRRPQRRAEARLRRALLRAVECGALPERSQELQHLLGGYYRVADMLAEVIKAQPAPFWDRPASGQGGSDMPQAATSPAVHPTTATGRDIAAPE